MDNIKFLEKAALECATADDLSRLINTTFSYNSTDFMIWSVVAEQLKNPSGEASESEKKLMKALEGFHLKEAKTLQLRRAFMQIDKSEPLSDPVNSELLRLIGQLTSFESLSGENNESADVNNSNSKVIKDASVVKLDIDITGRVKQMIKGKQPLREIFREGVNEGECHALLDLIQKKLKKNPKAPINPYALKEVVDRCYIAAATEDFSNIIEAYCTSTIFSPASATVFYQFPSLPLIRFMPTHDIKKLADGHNGLYENWRFLYELLKRKHPSSIKDIDIELDVCKAFYQSVLDELKGKEGPKANDVIQLAQCGLLALGLIGPNKHFDIPLFKNFVERRKTSILSRVPVEQQQNLTQHQLGSLISNFKKASHSIDFCQAVVVPNWGPSDCSEVSSLPLLNQTFYLFRNIESNIVQPYLDEIVFTELMERRAALPDDTKLSSFLFEAEWNRHIPFKTLVSTVLNVVSSRSGTTTLELFEKYSDLGEIDAVGIFTKNLATVSSTPSLTINNDVIAAPLSCSSHLNFVVESRFIRRLTVAVYELSPYDLCHQKEDKPLDVLSMDLDGQYPSFSSVFELPETTQDWKLVKTLVSVVPSTQRALLLVVVSGNGLSARVSASIGHVHAVSSATKEGHMFIILDEDGIPINGCALHLAGTRYTQAESPLPGDEIAPIAVPYRNPKEPQTDTIIIEVPNELSNLGDCNNNNSNTHCVEDENEEELKGECDFFLRVQRTPTAKRIPPVPFAKTEEFTWAAENYKLTTSFFIDEGSLATGSTGAVRCSASLELESGVRVPMSSIISGHIDITLTDARGATDLTTCGRLEEVVAFLEGRSGLCFRVIEDVRSVAISVEVQLNVGVTKTKTILSSSGNIAVGEQPTSSTFTGDIQVDNAFSYISSSGDGGYSGYVAAILDPSGTPKTGFPVNIKVTYKNVNKKAEISAITDNKGLVYLGELEDVNFVSVSWGTSEPDTAIAYATSNCCQTVQRMSLSSVSAALSPFGRLKGEAFQLPTFVSPLTPFNDIETVPGRKVFLPLSVDEIVRVSVHKLGFNQVVLDLADETDFTLVHEAGQPVSVTFAHEGAFGLFVRRNNKVTVEYVVHVNSLMTLDNRAINLRLCKKDNHVVNLTRTETAALIPIASRYDSEKDSFVVSMTCNTEHEDNTFKAFGCASRFVTDQCLTSVFRSEPDNTEVDVELRYKRPSVSRSTKLGEEAEYIKQRRLAEADGTRRIGCALHRPGIVLNRRSEASVQQKHKEAEVMEKVLADERYRGVAKAKCRAKAPRECLNECPCPVPSGRGGGVGSRCRERDFLPIREHPLLLDNLATVVTGPSTFDIVIPSILVRDSAFVDVIVSDSHGSVMGLSVAFPIAGEGDNPITRGFRDLRLAECRDDKKDYVECVSTFPTHPEEETWIRSANECEVAIFSSFQDFFRLTKAALATSFPQGPLRRLGKLEQWAQMTNKERREFMNTNLCHEVELFLLFKDPESFANIVHPLLASRFQPDFLDLYLVYIAPRHLQTINKFKSYLPSLAAIDKNTRTRLCQLASDSNQLTRVTPIEAIFLVDFLHVLAVEENDKDAQDAFQIGNSTLKAHFASSIAQQGNLASDRERISRIALNVASVEDVAVANDLGSDNSDSLDGEGSATSVLCQDEDSEMVEEVSMAFGVNISQERFNLQQQPQQQQMRRYGGGGRGAPQMFGSAGRVGGVSAPGVGFGLQGSPQPLMSQCASFYSANQQLNMPMRPQMQQQMLRMDCVESSNSLGYKPEPKPERFQPLSVTTQFTEMTWMDVGACGLGLTNSNSTVSLERGAKCFARQGWNAFWQDFSRFVITETSIVDFQQPFTTKNFLDPLLSGSYTEALVAFSVLSASATLVPQTSVVKAVANGGSVDWLVQTPDSSHFTASHIIAKQITTSDPTKTQKTNDALVVVKHRIIPAGAKAAAKMNELYVGTHYISEFTVINLSDSSKGDDMFQIVSQVPQGAVPLRRWNTADTMESGAYSKTTNVVIPPLASVTIKMHFFFPLPGSYKLPPAIVSFDGVPVSSSSRTAMMISALRGEEDSGSATEGGDKTQMVTVKQLSSSATTNGITDGVVFAGMSDTDVVEWLRNADLDRIFMGTGSHSRLGKNDPIVRALAPRLAASKALYTSVASILASRGWSSLSLHLVGFRHGDWNAIQKLSDYFLGCAKRQGVDVVPQLFSLSSPLLSFSPFNDATHFTSAKTDSRFSSLPGSDRLAATDFDPLVNERFFTLGASRTADNIGSEALTTQYTTLLQALALIPQAQRPPQYKLWVAYYMLLQNRVDEAYTLLADKKEEALACVEALADGCYDKLPIGTPFIQLCCLLSHIELSVVSNNTSLGASSFPLSSALARIPQSSPVYTTVFGRFLNELSEYMRRLTGSSGDETTTSVDGETDNEGERPTSYGKEATVTLTAEADCSAVHVSVPVEDGQTATLLFFPIDWEVLLVSSRSSAAAILVPKTTGRKKAKLIIEQVEPDDVISFLIPSECVVLSLEGDAGENVQHATAVVPEALRSTPFVVGVRTAVDKTRYFKLLPQPVVIIPDQNTGVLRVMNAAGQNVVGCYIRVMVERPGKGVGFWKDGYTDLVGRFDYATVSTQDISGVKRFVVYAEARGVGCALLRVAPPNV